MKKSGILLHITSLPSPYGIGDLGPEAYQFIDKIAQAGQRCWQILPLNPTDGISQHSPYSSLSSFAFNNLLISPDVLVEEGLLKSEDLKDIPPFSNDHVDFTQVSEYKNNILRKAYQSFLDQNCQLNLPGTSKEEFERKNTYWLDDYALFTVIKQKQNGASWVDWPVELRDRHPDALAAIKDGCAEDMDYVLFTQYMFERQWQRLKQYCNDKGIKIMGDLPLYVNHDSADVWQYRSLFKLESNGQPTVVAGVPPDYFSETGQRWGNPVYDWEVIKKDGFKWWVERVRTHLSRCDKLRIDHFRGLVNYWEIPADQPKATEGYWVKAPTDELFSALHESCQPLSLIAEDLGEIEPDVRRKIDSLGFPGMRILMFAFAGDMDTHIYLPHNHCPNCVAYTGTHDNNTVIGWLDQDVTDKEKANLADYLKRHDIVDQPTHWALVCLVMQSRAELAIIPVQDVLGLGAEMRMNTPATQSGNWAWRLKKEQLQDRAFEKLLDLTQQSGRLHD